ncbi:dopaminechrome tautomerase-like [Periplaneta americana]|uniref:dopaminechrome tautomerase-like n=1 Tax=Periplaneta americana TaxID=6978 RepID=UPI0037E89BAE
MQFPSPLVLLLMVATPLRAADPFQIVYQWKEVDYNFPSQQMRNNAINSGAYKVGNAVPLDMDVSNLDPYNRLFVTTPRFLPGVPATLNTVDPANGLLTPYPDWSWHTQGDCDGITSVLRTKIDKCGQLWVIDAGEVDTFTNASKRICQPQVLAFDITNDKFLWRYKLPDDMVKGRSLLGNVEVLLKNSCKNAYVYMADLQGYRVVVLDAVTPRSWIANSNLFYPYPFDGHFDINGRQFDLMDGVFGMALSPQDPTTGDSTMYFHSLASTWESMVSTRTLNKESNFRNGQSPTTEFSYSIGQRSGQAGPSAMDKQGRALFFSILPKNSLNCWSPRLQYRSENIVQLMRNDETFQFNSGLKIKEDANGREWLFALTSQLQNIITGSWDKNAVKYRILKAPVDVLVQGTTCA